MNANQTSIGTICVLVHKGRGSEDGRIPGHWMVVSDRLTFLWPMSNYTEQNTSWEAYSCPANLRFKEQEGWLSCLQESALVPTLSPADTDVLFLLTFILCCPPSTPVFHVFFPFRVFHYNFVCVSHFSHAWYMRRPSHSPGFVHFTCICGRARSTNY